MNKYQKLFSEFKQEQQSSTLDQNPNDNIVIFDGLNTFIRAFGATPSTNEDGDHIGGITGFLYSIGKVVRDMKPTRCIIVFDGRGGNNRRRKINSNYKANRANKTRLRRHDHHFASIEDEQEAMRHQFSRLVSYLDNLPVTFLSIDGIEADDTIAYIAEQYRSSSRKITIVSSDRDFYQMVDDTIQIWSPIKKKMYDTARVQEEFGCTPQNFVMLRTFIGDKSDNIEGVRGLGQKTVLKLLPELSGQDIITPDQVVLRSTELISENKKYQKIVDSEHILWENWKLMNLKLMDFPAQYASQIRKILEQPIPTLNRIEFQRLFMEDKMWTTMKNAPDWLTKTWLSLHSFAQKTHK